VVVSLVMLFIDSEALYDFLGIPFVLMILMYTSLGTSGMLVYERQSTKLLSSILSAIKIMVFIHVILLVYFISLTIFFMNSAINHSSPYSPDKEGKNWLRSGCSLISFIVLAGFIILLEYMKHKTELFIIVIRVSWNSFPLMRH
jgi:heme/copper-type cytochrome/quinol oxidase subunit 2